MTGRRDEGLQDRDPGRVNAGGIRLVLAGMQTNNPALRRGFYLPSTPRRTDTGFAERTTFA